MCSGYFLHTLDEGTGENNYLKAKDALDKYFKLKHRQPHPASRAFLLLARFWRSRKRLCMNRVRSLLNMRCMLPGYSLEPKPTMPDLAAILVFHGTSGSIITIGFVKKRTLALKKPV